jgi:NADH-quinone oxidoreductase subunit A
MLSDYAPVLLLVVMVLGFAVANLVLSELVGRKRKNVGKGDAYECGMQPTGNARMRLSIHFYLVAVLFILFDVESIFLIPWAVAARELSELGMGRTVLIEVVVFVVILAIGLLFVWRKGGLEWDR